LSRVCCQGLQATTARVQQQLNPTLLVLAVTGRPTQHCRQQETDNRQWQNQPTLALLLLPLLLLGQLLL
jgi:hypothetical protein